MIDVRIAKNGTGFQPWPNFCSIFLGLCPRLILASPSALRKTLDSLLGPQAGSISAWGEAPCTGIKYFNRAVSLGYPSANRGSPNKYSVSGHIKTSPQKRGCLKIRERIASAWKAKPRWRTSSFQVNVRRLQIAIDPGQLGATQLGNEVPAPVRALHSARILPENQ